MTEKLISDLTLRPILKCLSFGLVLASAPVFFSPGAAASEQQAAANFLVADANADGALTLAEFKTLIDLNAAYGIGKSQMVRDRGIYDRAFGRLDANSDGRVSSAEIQNASR